MSKSIGLFVPPPVAQGESASTRNSGIGRLPHATQMRVLSLIESAARNEKYEVFSNLDFRNFYSIDGQVFSGNTSLNKLDIYFWYAEIDRRPASFDLEILQRLSATVSVIRDPFSYEQSLDKFIAFSHLKKIGFPVPSCALISPRNIDSIHSIVEEWGGGVIKPRRGGFGKGVLFIENSSQFRDVIEYAGLVKNDLTFGHYIEKYYPNDPTKWVSLTVVNGEVMYGYRKKETRFVALGPGLKVYDANEVGGEIELHEPTETQKKIAIDAAMALKMDIVGFDMITTPEGSVIVDVNTFPGYYEELFEKVGKDPALEFVKIVQRYL